MPTLPVMFRRLVELVSLCLLPAGLLVAQAPAPKPLRPEQVQRSIDKARDWLLKQQGPNGSWDNARFGNASGPTALAMLALANAGVAADNLNMQRGLKWLRGQESEDTYSVSLQTMALAIVSPDADRKIIQRNVEWLERTQIRGGPNAGAWNYGHRQRGGGDPSNSQFAVLALHEAARVGVRVRDDTWKKAQEYWADLANADGSWGYHQGTAGTGSMTCAGISSVWITTEHVGLPDARAQQESVSCCGGGASPKLIDRGLDWLGKRFTVRQNPGGPGEGGWLFYYIYGLERVGRFTARRFIGEHDWYLEGASTLVQVQNDITGNFVAPRIEDPIIATSFALLFLAKGRRPVIVAKSRHEPDADWNRHGHDIAHLVEYVEGRWRKDYPAGLSWHVVDTPSATVADLLQAPVFWLSGKTLFDLGPDAGKRLRQYIDEGGFVFAEACCPKSGEFDRRLRQLVGEIFPEPEYRLRLLPPEHPAWHAEEIVPPELHRPLLGVDYGCRTSLIYAPPTDLEAGGQPMPSLSCLWELGGHARKSLPAPVQREVRAALDIGTNVLAYATNRELKRKDELLAVAPRDANAAARGGRGQLALVKLKHSGMCDAAPAALANILRAAARELGTPLSETPGQIDPADAALFDHHLVFMHGRQGFAFDRPRRERIAQFVDRGGTLLADSVCASAGFTQAFRTEIAAILPDHTLEEIPADDPIFTAGQYGGYDIREVTLREPAGGDGPLGVRRRKITPKLEGVRVKDRWAVIFSPFDLSCALEKQNSMECTGYSREDAEKIALNVLLYSINR
jgi:hypothetical protein